MSSEKKLEKGADPRTAIEEESAPEALNNAIFQLAGS